MEERLCQPCASGDLCRCPWLIDDNSLTHKCGSCKTPVHVFCFGKNEEGGPKTCATCHGSLDANAMDPPPPPSWFKVATVDPPPPGKNAVHTHGRAPSSPAMMKKASSSSSSSSTRTMAALSLVLDSPKRFKKASTFPASLPFRVITITVPRHTISKLTSETRKAIKPLLGSTPELVDIMLMVKPDPKTQTIYIFDPEEFKPIMETQEALTKVRKKLIMRLREQGLLVGNRFTSYKTLTWGGGKEDSSGTILRFSGLRCDLSTLARDNNNKIRDGKEKASATNNKRKLTNRPNGNKGLSRNSGTKRASCVQDCCACKTTNIYNNQHCFFAVAHGEQILHTNHQKMSYAELTAGSSILPPKEAANREVMSFATSSGSSQANGLRKMSNHKMTKQAACNAKKNDVVSLKVDVDEEELRAINNRESLTKLLLKYECRVIAMTHKVCDSTKENTDWMKKSDTASSLLTTHDILSAPSTSAVTLTVAEKGQIERSTNVEEGGQEAAAWVSSEKSAYSKDSKHLLCLAWANEDQIKLARAFSQSLSIDCTHKATADGYYLFTVTVRDSQGKTTVVARIWIPNQKKFMFRFVMFEVIPNLFGHDMCTKVRVVVSDGDIHQTSILDLAIERLYKNAVRIPCAWHLVDRPMNERRGRFHLQQGVSKYFLMWFMRFLQTWLYSWMRPSGGVYREEEFKISKAILLTFIESKDLKTKFTPAGVATIKDYVLHVLGSEHQFKSITSNDVFALELYSNSSHEGTNKGIKYDGANKVTPTMSLGMSTNNLCLKDEQTAVERLKIVTDDYNKYKTGKGKQWNELSTNAAGILIGQEQKSDSVLASTWLPDENAFLVVCPNDVYGGKLAAEMALQNKAKEAIDILDKGRTRQQKRSRLNALIHNISKPTWVELGNLKFSDLLTCMSAREKASADRFGNSEESMQMPEFMGVFKLHLVQDPSGRWYLTCNCKFGKRYGGPCCHKFFVKKVYLESKVIPWNYRQVSIIHWAQYAYLMLKPLVEMSGDEKIQHCKFTKIDPTDHFGTLCQVCGVKDGDVKWNEIITNDGDLRDSRHNKSAQEWEETPYEGRCLTYSEDQILNCLNALEQEPFADVNSSQYDVFMSQPTENADGWQSVGFEHHITDSSQTNTDAGRMFDNCMNNTDVDQFHSLRYRRADLTKDFQEAMNSANLKDEVQMRYIKHAISIMKGEIQHFNEQIQPNRNPAIRNGATGTYFPNFSYAPATKDKISDNK